MRTVFLHAFPFDERMWDGYDGFAPRLYGPSGSIDEWARSVASNNLLQGEPVAVVGASMGGYCAQRLLVYADVRALALIGSRADPDTQERRRARDETIRLLVTEGVEALWERQRPALFPDDADESVVARARELALEQDAGELTKAVQAMRDRPDSRELVQQTEAPVLVARGEHDPFLSVEEADALARSARDGRAHTFAGCGHLPSFERPDEFKRVITEFLAGV